MTWHLQALSGYVGAGWAFSRLLGLRWHARTTDLRVLVTAQPQAYQPQDQLGLLTKIKLHHDYIVTVWR